MASSDLFTRYLRHNEINAYLDRLALKYPDNVSVQTCGQTYEGRELKSIRIHQAAVQSTSTKTPTRRKSLATSTAVTAKGVVVSASAKTQRKRRSKSSRSGSLLSAAKSTSALLPSIGLQQQAADTQLVAEKPVVLIDGGIHAREWISVATALYCVHQLAENRSENCALLDKLDFVILPLVNADGYEYSHLHKRFWRKSRQPVQGGEHIGTDCNRNFDYHWSSACARASRSTFRGDRPFSEPETHMLKSVMHSLATSCKFYLTLHSYAQAFMYPWGYTKDRPSNWRALHRLAQAGHLAIKRQTGKHYRCGSVALLIKHTAAGGSPDYALGVVKIPYAMAMELSGGGHGFDPPCTAIRGLVGESWIGIQAMCAHIADKS